MDEKGNATTVPVTAVISRMVRPGRENDFEAWADVMTPVVKSFPGYLGTDVIRPRGPTQPEYVIILRFNEYKNLKAFLVSPERAAVIKQSEELTEGEAKEQVAEGMVSFFNLSPHTGIPSPAKYKMAVLTILVIYLPLLAISTAIGAIFHGLPRPLSILISLSVLVPLMTWFIMPLTTRLFRKWLFPRAQIS